jgi:hypothetical protein
MTLNPVNILRPQHCGGHRRTAAALLVLLAPVLFTLGCGSEAKTTVTGKVTVNGKPAAAGAMVVFVGADSKQMSAMVGADGAYTMTDPPVGEVKVAVKPDPAATGAVVAAKDMPGMGGPAATGEAIPNKYADPNNGLTFTVVKGSNKPFNIELTGS